MMLNSSNKIPATIIIARRPFDFSLIFYGSSFIVDNSSIASFPKEILRIA